MPAFRLPLSGNVTQSINPWTMLFNPVGSQVGLVNIDLGQSSQPEVEQEVLTDVASYGKQIGRIEDALIVLLDHFNPGRSLTVREQQAIDGLLLLGTLRRMLKARSTTAIIWAIEIEACYASG